VFIWAHSTKVSAASLILPSDALYASYGIPVLPPCGNPDGPFERLECMGECKRYGFNCGGYPTPYIELFAQSPEPLPPDAPIPVINTCMEPISITVDPSNRMLKNPELAAL
jgi:hypothetical protein